MDCASVWNSVRTASSCAPFSFQPAATCQSPGQYTGQGWLWSVCSDWQSGLRSRGGLITRREHMESLALATVLLSIAPLHRLQQQWNPP